MSRDINTSFIGESTDIDSNAEETMIKVDNVTMVFNMASEKLNNLKEYVIAIARRELMFKAFHALEDVSFEVKRGDVFGILGTNGSGKSTMLKIVAGVLEPTKGTVEVNGKIAPLIELGAGFDMDLTARENIYLNGALLGYPRKFIDQNFDDIVEFAEIEQFLDMPLKNYSSGMVARIAFAIATVIVPEILIVDEVLSVGDFMFQQKCERRISDLIKNHGVTVLIVSHNNDQIERLCNKAIWIEKGHTRMMGTASEVCGLYRAIGGREGSIESERRIMELIDEDVSGADDAIDAITGDNRYSTSVSIASSYTSAQKTAMLVSADCPDDSILTTALAGVLDAVMFNTRQDILPEAAHQAISHLDPDEIVLMGTGEFIGTDIEASLRDEGLGEVSRIGRTDKTQMSLDVYERGRRSSLGWGSTCVIAVPDAAPAYISLSPVIYGERMPVFFASASDVDANARVCNAVAEGGFDRVLVLLDQDPGFAELVESVRQRCSAVEVLEFSDSNPVALSRSINEWVDAEREHIGSSPATRFVLTTAWEPVDAYLIGPYAWANDALVVVDNPENMDNAVQVMDFIASRKSPTENLIFLGGLARFNRNDRMVLAKAALLDARSRG